MKSQNPALRTAIATAVLAGAGMTSFSALAASSASLQRPDAAARAEIQQTYRAERAACLDGSSPQERGACLAEAAAARKEALAGVLGVQTVAGVGRVAPTEPDLMANALARCDAVPSDVRSDCERRVTGGDGVIVIGSVAEGVIVRELAPVEAPLVLAQAEAASSPSTETTTPAASEPAALVLAEPTEPAMEAEPATAQAAAPAQDGVVGAGLSEGETLVPAAPAAATSLMAEPPAETLPETTEPAMMAPVDAAPVQTAPAEMAPAEMAPAEAGPAATEPALAEPPAAIEPTSAEPAAERTPAAIEAGPASGADPVAYPEWMTPIRFE